MPTISPASRQAKSRVIVTASFTPEEFAKADASALQKMNQDVRVPGFRPGNAPADIVRSKVDPEVLFERTLRELLTPTFMQAIEQEKIEPILPPSVSIKSREPLTLEVVFVEKPEAKVKNVDKIKVDKMDPKADDKDVQRMLDYLKNQYRSTKEIEEAAAHGHQITMNFAGKDKDDKEIEGTRSTNYQVVVGSKSLIPGFEDNLVGLKKGDKKSFTLTFPDKYHAEHLRNQPVTFDVDVTKVEEVHSPELTDEFIKEHQIAESRTDLEKNIRESMVAQEERMERERRESALFDEIRKATTIDLADELIDSEGRNIAEQLGEQLQDQKMTLEQWLAAQKKTAEELQKELKEEAIKRLTLRFGIEKVLEEKNIEVAEDEMKEIVAREEARHAGHEAHGHSHDFSVGSQNYEQLKWQRKIEKMMETMLG